MTGQRAAREWESRKDDIGFWANRGLDDMITDYVRCVVRGTRFNSRDYIRELMEIEAFCASGVRCLADGIAFHRLREKYPEEYRMIRSELDPEGSKEDAPRCIPSEAGDRPVSDFWEKAEKMTPEERKAAHMTQWASAMQENIKAQQERCDQDKKRERVCEQRLGLAGAVKQGDPLSQGEWGKFQRIMELLEDFDIDLNNAIAELFEITDRYEEGWEEKVLDCALGLTESLKDLYDRIEVLTGKRPVYSEDLDQIDEP